VGNRIARRFFSIKDGEVMAALTEKQKRFIDYYIETGNATEAARLSGYRGKNLNRIGSENLSKLDICIKDRILQKEDERIAKQDEVLQTLTRIIRREEKEVVVVTVKSRRSFYDENGKKVIEEKEEPVPVEIPTKISDVNKAADLLGKRYGIWTDNVKIFGNVPVQIVDDLGSDTDGD